MMRNWIYFSPGLNGDSTPGLNPKQFNFRPFQPRHIQPTANSIQAIQRLEFTTHSTPTFQPHEFISSLELALMNFELAYVVIIK
jgi:hypothetical protein